MNEWELLEIADDIEPGDSLAVESDEGSEVMIFKRYINGMVWCRDESGTTRKFRASSLEEIGGSGYITGKAE